MSESEPEPGSRFVVFNDVTNSVEETDQDPNFGDPNQSLQNQVLSAYGGGSGMSLSAASTLDLVPTPSTIGDPAASALTAVQSAGTAVSAETQAQLQAVLGPMASLGGIPGAMGIMASNAQLVLNNTTKVFAGIDNIFQPEQAGTPGRCASLSDFLGSLQGKYNNTLESISSGLASITNALVSVPLAVLNAFTATANLLVQAVATGVTSVINAAISPVISAANAVLGGLGKAGQTALNGVASKVDELSAGLQAETSNLTAALNSLLNNPFKMVVPTVNACMKTIFESNPDTQSQNTGVAALGIPITGA
jgi:hypothetical protein